MTQQARCPNCSGVFYAPDPSNGGTGRNKCLSCRQASPVADWYAGRAMHKLRLNDMYRQEIIPNPEGFRTDKHTGNLRPAKDHELYPGERGPTADREPAPIRQYKDD